MREFSRHHRASEPSRCLRQGCERPPESYGFCQRHYVHFRRTEPQRHAWLRGLSKERRRFEIDKMREAEKAKDKPVRWEWEGDSEALAQMCDGQQDSK